MVFGREVAFHKITSRKPNVGMPSLGPTWQGLTGTLESSARSGLPRWPSQKPS